MGSDLIKGITIEIGGDTTKLSTALGKVNGSIRSTQSQLKDVNKLLKLDPKNTELVAQKQRLLKDAVKDTEDKLKTLKTAAEQANTQLQNNEITKEQYDALQREIIATEQSLASLDKQAAAANKTLMGISDVGEKLEAAGGKITDIGKTVSVASAAVTGLGASAIGTTAAFDSQMSTVQSISGAAGEDFDKLREKAIEMGSSTSFSSSEAAQAMEYMAMAGWSTNDMLDGIGGIMNAAAASGEDLAKTSDILTDGLTAFGLSAADSGHFADVLVKTGNSANTSVSMMGETFKYAGAVCGSLGISVEDAAIATGLMGNAGIKASQAGTALRTGLTNLVKPSKQAATAMEKYGVDIQTTDDGSVDFMATMINVREALGGLSETEQAAAISAIFGKNAMSGWSAIVNASEKDFDGLTEAIYSADGAAQEAADIKLDNLEGQITILQSTMEGIAIQIGDILMPTVRAVVAKIQDFADAFKNLDAETKKHIVQVGVVVAALGPLLVVIGTVVTKVGVALQAFSKFGMKMVELASKVGRVEGVLAKIQTAMAAISAPVIAAVAIIGTLTAAFVYLWNTNEEFRNAIGGIWDGIVEKISEFCDGIVERLNGLGLDFSSVTDALKAVWDGFCTLLVPVFEGVFQEISTILSAVLDTLTGLLDVFIGIFTGDWDTAWQGITEIFSAVWEAVKGTFSNVLDMLKGLADAFLSLFETDWETAWESVQTFFSDIWEGISEFFSGILDGIQEVAETVWTAISKFIGTIMNTIGTAISSAWNGIYEFIEPLLTSLQYLFETIWGAIKLLVGNAVTAMKTKITTVWKAIVDFLKPILTSIKTNMQTAWNGIKSVITAALSAIKSGITTAWNAIKEVINKAMTAIKTFSGKIWSSIKSSTSSKVGQIKSTIVSGFQKAVSYITGLADKAYKWGSDIIGGIVKGIKASISKVSDAVTSVADKIHETLHFSVPDVGPLADADTYMPDMMKLFAKGIRDNIILVQKAGKEAAGAVSEALGSKKLKKDAQMTADNTVKVLRGVPAGAFKSGTEMCRELARGIETNISTVSGAGKRVAGAIISPVVNGALKKDVQETTSSTIKVLQGVPAGAFKSGTEMCRELARGIETNISVVAGAGIQVAGTLSDYIKNKNLKEDAQETADDTVKALREIPAGAFESGVDMCQELARGIRAHKNAVLQEVEQLAREIDDRIGFSVPKYGPLSQADTYMPDMMQLFVEGVQRSQGRLIDAIRQTAAQISAAFQNMIQPGPAFTGQEMLRQDLAAAENNARVNAAFMSGINSMLDMLHRYLPYLAAGKELRFDTREWAGVLAPDMNVELNRIRLREERR